MVLSSTNYTLAYQFTQLIFAQQSENAEMITVLEYRQLYREIVRLLMVGCWGLDFIVDISVQLVSVLSSNCNKQIEYTRSGLA